MKSTTKYVTQSERIAKRYIPEHNEIDPERPESHYHCEECARVIMARAKLALREAMREAYRDAAKMGNAFAAKTEGDHMLSTRTSMTRVQAAQAIRNYSAAIEQKAEELA